MRHGTTALLLLAPIIMMGQEMLLSQSVMYVHPGTTLQIHGDVQWNISTGSQVINDGRIEFRDAAVLNEAPGGPITGMGTEHAWIEQAIPMNEFAPGGLGLELTSATAIGPLELVRGHLPFQLDNEQESVARWFSFADGVSVQLDHITFRFDATELNGLNPAQLDLHDAEDPIGTWVPMLAYPGADQQSLYNYQVAPREYITAFHLDAVTSVAELDMQPAFRVWPTITSGLVDLHAPEGVSIERLELFDMQGRQLPLTVQNTAGGSHILLDLSSNAYGPYLLRVNGRQTFKLVKE
jgi:hypothetical protein